MSGWIKIHRRITEWEWYQDANTKNVFFHLLLTANHKDKKYRGLTIRKGERLCGLQQLADELNISIQNVRTALKHLKLTGEITEQSSNKGRLITVVKYDDYQQDNNQPNRQLTGSQQAANKQLTTTKEGKKERRKEYITPLPPFLNPQAWEDFVQYRKEIKNPLTPRAEKAILNKLEKFNAEGQDTTEIINESISSGWAGVFPLKNRKGSSHIRSGSNGTGQSKTWTIMPDGRLKKPDGTFWKKTEDGGLVPL